MRRKTMMTAFFAASLSAAACLTSYAGWVQDENGWGYQREDGSWAPCGWFTDPEDGTEYYLDPDGYMMTETRVEGFWLDSNGQKHEKTQAELDAEAARAARIAARPTPNKAALAVEAAAEAAKSTNSSAATQRTYYQAEMKVYMDRIFLDMANKLYADVKDRRAKVAEAAKEAAIQASMDTEDGITPGDLSIDYSNLYPTDTNASDDNYGTNYSIFRNSDRQDIIAGSFSKIKMEKSKNYVPHAFELSYNRGIANSDEETVIFDEGYRQLLVAALGENVGKEVYDNTLAGTITDDAAGNTDTGNSYHIAYKNGLVTIQVTCSEAKAETENSSDESNEEQAAEEQEESTPVTSTVIVAGQKKAAEETETAE